MLPELRAASDAAHSHAADEEDPEFDRVVAVGFLVSALEGLCPPHIWLLNEIVSALYDVHDGEEQGQHPLHPH